MGRITHVNTRATVCALASDDPGTMKDMWQALLVCSSCAEETEVVVENLDDVDREACPCGYSYVVLSVATFEPVYAERAELIELAPRKRLPLAA